MGENREIIFGDEGNGSSLRTVLTIAGIGILGYFTYKFSKYVKIAYNLENGIIYMFDEKDKGVFSDELTLLNKKTISMVPSNVQIKLIMSTRGGSSRNCMELLRHLQNHPAGYTVYVYDRSHSAGTILALGAKEIVMTKYSTLSKIDPIYDDFSAIHAQKVLDIITESKSLNLTTLSTIYESKALLQLTYDVVKGLIQDSGIADKVIEKMIDSPLPHAKAFTIKECQEMGLKVREPTKDELKYFAF